ncbi:MAG: heavy metal translocating P-type ATPase, partial [Thiothrix sp.]|nr:heavy metal translocating P-type ATPase [Thiothrix sp.]
LTGESVPVHKAKGDRVTGGTLNGSGSFLMQVSRIGADTVLAQIIERVREAQASKPAIARLTDKVASIFVPVVVGIAILTFLIWYWVGPEPQLSYALVTAMTVLVIACPCALGLATPISIIAGVGKAAQQGILIRNGDALQQAAAIDTVVLDKTGTITAGKPVLQAIHVADGQDENRLLQLTATLEKGSEHPLAQAIRTEADKRGLKTLVVTGFHSISGHGIRAQYEGQAYQVGNVRLMQTQGLALDGWRDVLAQLDTAGLTPVFLADQAQILALFGIADAVKPDAAASIAALKAQGLDVIMLTGDRREVAEHIAAQVGIGTLHAEVLPEQKLAVIETLQQQGRKVAMVGDGVNDAPALARADVGFAIGAGTDVAMAAADVTLVGGSLAGIDKAIRISRATTRNIWQNLFGAFVYNSLGIPVAAGILYPLTGMLLNPMIAGAAMALSSVTVVVNANRLGRLKV